MRLLQSFALNLQDQLHESLGERQFLLLHLTSHPLALERKTVADIGLSKTGFPRGFGGGGGGGGGSMDIFWNNPI